MSHKVLNVVSSISTLSDQYMDKQALEKEQFQTLKRQDIVLLTPAGDVQDHVNLSARDVVQSKTPAGNTRDGTTIYREEVMLRSREGIQRH